MACFVIWWSMTESKKKQKNFVDKSKDAFKKFTSSPKMKELKELATDNKGETAAFLLVIIGILITFANPIWGSAIVGLVAGFYFYEAILDWIGDLGRYIKKIGTLKASILLALLILFFIAYPLMFITMAIVVAIMQLIQIVNKKS